MQEDSQATTSPFAHAGSLPPTPFAEAIWFLDSLVIVRQSAAEGALFGLLEYQMPAESQTPLHRHLDEEESVYVLEGDLRIFVGDHVLDVGPGAYVRLPIGVPHGLYARSAVRMLVFTKADGFVEFVRAMGVPAPSLTLPPSAPPDVARLLSLATRHDLEILGPLPAASC